MSNILASIGLITKISNNKFKWVGVEGTRARARRVTLSPQPVGAPGMPGAFGGPGQNAGAKAGGVAMDGEAATCASSAAEGTALQYVNPHLRQLFQLVVSSAHAAHL